MRAIDPRLAALAVGACLVLTHEQASATPQCITRISEYVLTIESVTIDGAPVQDLSAYNALLWTLRPEVTGEDATGGLVLTATDRLTSTSHARTYAR